MNKYSSAIRSCVRHSPALPENRDDGGSLPSSPRLWRTSQPSAFSSGFSLVEVAMALMVVGVAILSIITMFPMALDQNTRSIADTHAALFADEVFASLRPHAETNWHKIGTDLTALPVAGRGVTWYEPTPGAFVNYLTDVLWTNIYRRVDNPDIVDHALRYRATLATNGSIKSLTLRVWPGEFGTTSNPTIFYSEFYRLNQ